MSWILGGTLGEMDFGDEACISICLPFGGPGTTVGARWSWKGNEY